MVNFRTSIINGGNDQEEPKSLLPLKGGQRKYLIESVSSRLLSWTLTAHGVVYAVVEQLTRPVRRGELVRWCARLGGDQDRQDGQPCSH